MLRNIIKCLYALWYCCSKPFRYLYFKSSWKTMFSKTAYNWAPNQYIDHSTTGIQSYTDTTSVSSDICVFRFYFVEPTMANHLPIDGPPPVFPLLFGCTANNISIQHFNMPLPLALRISGKLFVTLMYLIRWNNFPQYSLAGSLTLLVRNETTVHVSVLARLVANNLFVTRWWKSTAFLILIFYRLRKP